MADIAPLARHFLAQHDPRLSLSPSALSLLEAQPWTGNIRELRNVVTKAALLAVTEEIAAADLSFTVSSRHAIESAMAIVWNRLRSAPSSMRWPQAAAINRGRQHS